MRSLRQFVGDEWRGLSEGLAEDRVAAREKRQAAWAPYGGPSRYFLSGAWKAFIILFTAAMLGLLTALVLHAVVPAVDGLGAWIIASMVWFVLVGLGSGLGRPRPSGTREISTGPMLKNLFVYTPLTVVAYAWAAFWIGLIVLGGVGLLIFGLRFL